MTIRREYHLDVWGTARQEPTGDPERDERSRRTLEKGIAYDLREELLRFAALPPAELLAQFTVTESS